MKIFWLNLISLFSLYKFTNPDSCQVNQYYNQINDTCENCPENSVSTSDHFGCICDNKSIYEYNETSKTFDCARLENKSFPTDDRFFSVDYDSSDSDSYMYYNSSQDIVICKPKNNVTYEMATNDVFGRPFDYVKCIPNQTIDQNSNNTNSNRKNNNKNNNNNNYNKNNNNKHKRRLENEYKVEYYNEDDNEEQKNKIEISFDIDNIINQCETNKIITACQSLANYCTLTLYNEEETPCQKLKELEESGADYIPHLDPLDESKNAEKYLKSENAVGIEVTYDPENFNIYSNQLELFAATYYLNGTFKGMEKLDDKLIFCSNSINAASNYSMFGNDLLIDCTIDLAQLMEKETNEQYFYEIFLKNALKEATTYSLITVPILIDNIKYNDKFQNETNMEKWILKNRMFLSYNYKGSRILYAQRIKFVVELINTRKEHNIYRPYFEVFYSTRSISTKDSRFESKEAYVSFISEYKVEIKSFMKACLAFLIVCIIVVLAIVVFRMLVWVQLNPKELTPESFSKTFLLTLLMKICKWWGIFSFWYCLIVCAYWYFFFKLAYRIYLLLPPQEEYNKYYRKFDVMFGIGFGTYMIFMILRIYFQVSFDIYFIDWEHEKEMFKNNSGDEATTSKYSKYRCAWRLIHVANQFNALQKQRLTSLFFAFCWHIILYYKAHWDYREVQTPGKSVVFYGRTNYILRLFISPCIIFSALIIQYVVIRILQNWIPLKKQEFIDLCFISNISVFILDEKLHGFYIHGHNPANKADVNLNELLSYLNNAENVINPEMDNEDDCKSYVMYISYPMRTIYDGLFYIQNEALLAQNQGIDLQKFVKERKLGPMFKYLPEIKEKNFNMLSSYMNNQLRNKMDNVFKNKNNYIREKTFIQNVLELPASNTQVMNAMNTEEIILYKDYGLKFDDVFFSGMEWEWIMMDIYIYQFWTRILHNCEIGILLTYICDYFLYFVRAYFGEKNLSRKAVIDERFIS